MDELEPVESSSTEVTVPQVYLRLEGVYQGDIRKDQNKDEYITAFLFHFTDMLGAMYIAPVTCAKDDFDNVQKVLSKIFPVIIAFLDDAVNCKTTDKPQETSSISALKETGNKTTH